MKKVLFAGILTVNLFFGCSKSKSEIAFDEFMNNEHKESFIVLPLCAAGESVVPIVIEKIKNKNMERRTYAILFLGVTESKLPLPVLQDIVKDESETEGYQARALQSVYLLNEDSGKKLAGDYQNRENYLGETARELLQVKDYSVYKKEQKVLICNPKD